MVVGSGDVHEDELTLLGHVATCLRHYIHVFGKFRRAERSTACAACELLIDEEEDVDRIYAVSNERTHHLEHKENDDDADDIHDEPIFAHIPAQVRCAAAEDDRVDDDEGEEGSDEEDEYFSKSGGKTFDILEYEGGKYVTQQQHKRVFAALDKSVTCNCTHYIRPHADKLEVPLHTRQQALQAAAQTLQRPASTAAAAALCRLRKHLERLDERDKARPGGDHAQGVAEGSPEGTCCGPFLGEVVPVAGKVP